MELLREDVSSFTEDVSPLVEDVSSFTEDVSPLVEDLSSFAEDVSPLGEDPSSLVEDASPRVEEVSPSVDVLERARAPLSTARETGSLQPAVVSFIKAPTWKWRQVIRAVLAGAALDRDRDRDLDRDRDRDPDPDLDLDLDLDRFANNATTPARSPNGNPVGPRAIGGPREEMHSRDDEQRAYPPADDPRGVGRPRRRRRGPAGARGRLPRGGRVD